MGLKLDDLDDIQSQAFSWSGNPATPGLRLKEEIQNKVGFYKILSIVFTTADADNVLLEDSLTISQLELYLVSEKQKCVLKAIKYQIKLTAMNVPNAPLNLSI
jgi:hypothetical protein